MGDGRHDLILSKSKRYWRCPIELDLPRSPHHHSENAIIRVIQSVVTNMVAATIVGGRLQM
eukprot:scaffold15883_cov155-Skeletonema_dohrnii-CCMP3373.AAC.3